MFRADTDAGRDAALIMAALAGILIQPFMTDGPHDPKDLIEHLNLTVFQRLLISADGSTPAGRL